MFIVSTLIDRNLNEGDLQYNVMDNDIVYTECPMVFSTLEKAMEYVKRWQGIRPGVYCMVFEEQIDYPFDIPVVWNGKFDSI